ncbi:hypothetical protein CF088_05310 [Clostridium botulinum]|uniref:hypothetical protein n=1 Tax=Clostridium botulinum TaxID=1491 RepID=UPI0004656BAF|nr:hypothetical protein [Clostridium botulinum]APH24068.1 hypothetical protein NPD1_3785 [Clostridium botulinum]APQ67226.1 hypothetical protein RSJ8_1912 [Clostridium botulinum]APQ99473.1 hypothetical protein RSJ2_2223 [Clostridium botulinum]MBN3377624.1 hypothetical protein [Clostridium botulinum]MBN3404724.1 hypothetical protein [Clostridium botulinum]
MTNSDLDEFDLAGLELTEEQKSQFRKLDAAMDRIINLVAGIKPFDIKEIKILNKSKTWNKSRFYE